MIHFLLQLIKILIQNDDPSARAADPIWIDSRNCSANFATTIQIIESTDSDISSSIPETLPVLIDEDRWTSSDDNYSGVWSECVSDRIETK